MALEVRDPFPLLHFELPKLIIYSIPEVNCGIICGCLPILPAFFRHIYTELRSGSQSLKLRNSRYPSSNIYRGRRQLGSGILDTIDLELDETDLIGKTASDSIKTSVATTSDANKVGEQVQTDGILRQIDIEQSYLKKTGDSQ